MENLAKRVGLSNIGGWMMASVLLVGSVACGPVEQTGSGSMESFSTQGQELEGLNGVTVNGVTVNGVTVNGVTVNGVTVNGVTVNGLATLEFAQWFSQDAANNATLMSYIVRCAVPAGQTRRYLDASTATTYSWQGSLGLAPDWANGQPINAAEQQLVSACLAAHVNKFGMHVQLSVLGRTAHQQPIAYSSAELNTFARREGCFFGNLFTGEGMFAGSDGDYLNESESSPRACAMTTQEGASDAACSPMTHVGSCESLCTLDPSGLFYESCTYNGQTYLPLTTRISQEDVYACGDGVCQFTESCGTDDTASSCFSDCGACK